LDDIPLTVLFGILFLLIILSAFFSGSETALMSLNRYRLKHLAKINHRGAVKAQKLLQRPDRLIGLILLGNNFVNILASALATVIGIRLAGEAGIALATIFLTIVILIFAEVTPKTLGALHPEKLAYPAAYIYSFIIWPLYPAVYVVNLAANSMLKLIGVSTSNGDTHSLSSEELRTVVNEASAMIPKRHQKMLLSILDLEKVTVEDIMVPKSEIVGVDMDDELDDIREQLNTSQYTRLPVFRENIDNIIGFLHVRKSQYLLSKDSFAKSELEEAAQSTCFIPEGTPLNKQLLNFQRQKQRIGVVVDEYGDVQGLATLEDILEEIVGEFTSDPSTSIKDVLPQEDGSFVVAGSANIRDLNRLTGWDLPTDGPKTLNGLILEYLESIPESGTSLRLSGYPIDIMQTSGNVVKKVRFHSLSEHPRTSAKG